ncbi:leucine-rich repeat-containing protein 23-like [Halichondria panicea]|uniref:leucine-rich repeat-containing protein 23-like n=1 Tax=Halichondria panicea TaxID=6063 RepID=UPI00312B7086
MSEEEFRDFDEELSEGDPEEGEGEVEVVEQELTKELAGECLSLLSRTGNGLSHAYVRLDLKNRKLTDIAAIQSFVHVRYVDVSGNYLEDISPLGELPQLLTLHADNNRLATINLKELQYLQVASFAQNKLTTTEGLSQPMLDRLNLSSNQITELSGLTETQLPCLTSLDLHGNKLTSTIGIHLPSLQKLYLASNTLTKLEGLEGLRQLTTLHVRENQITTLDGFAPSMEGLQYLNLRGNAVEVLSELTKLQCLPFLRGLVLAECPLCELDEYRVEVLILLRGLERLDKDEYTEDERADAEELSKQRAEEEAPENETVEHT